MMPQNYVELIVFVLILLVLSYPLGIFINKVMRGERTFLHPFLYPAEKFIYKVSQVDPDENQSWLKYTVDILLFSVFSCVVTFFILKYQSVFPLNPQKFPSLATDLSFNTAVSFLTNTNWQAYGGESTMSYFSQMVALAPHNFMSAALGLAACIAVVRGLTTEKAGGLGNFWADLTRSTLYILLPLSFIIALFYISQGMIQNFLPYIQVKTLEGGTQTIAQGPVASQAVIKLLGTNGGGFFNANGAHPYENPSALTNYVQMLTMFLLSSALVFTFGKMAKHMRHAVSIWIAMAVLFLGGFFTLVHYEYQGNPMYTQALHLSSPANMEGKETRFGLFDTSLFATVTTDTSCGATIGAHGSLLPMAGFVPLVNMLLGEIIFGGVGSGLYSMLLFIILAVFIAGLMVGRTPEYLGKKIESLEVKLTMLPLIAVCGVILILTALSSVLTVGFSSVGNPGPHGFSEMFYAYTSSAQNNGSAFASLNANTPFWNYSTSIAMLVGRYLSLIPMLAIAGYMGKKQIRSIDDSAFPLHGGLFIILLIGTIVIVGALTYLPALSLGPVLEHLQMMTAK